MEKAQATRLLNSIGGTRPDTLLRFGYVTKAGDYTTVEAKVVSFHGNPDTGDYTGLRARVVMTTSHLPRKEDGTTLFSLDRIEQGEQIRAARKAERIANGTAIAAEQGASSLFRTPSSKRPTERQCRYAAVLSERDGEGLGYDDFAAMTRGQVSAWIDGMQGN